MCLVDVKLCSIYLSPIITTPAPPRPPANTASRPPHGYLMLFGCKSASGESKFSITHKTDAFRRRKLEKRRRIAMIAQHRHNFRHGCSSPKRPAQSGAYIWYKIAQNYRKPASLSGPAVTVIHILISRDSSIRFILPLKRSREEKNVGVQQGKKLMMVTAMIMRRPT